MREWLTGVGILCMDAISFKEWADDIGSWLAAWSYVPVQYYNYSLCIFYVTLVVGEDTY